MSFGNFENIKPAENASEQNKTDKKSKFSEIKEKAIKTIRTAAEVATYLAVLNIPMFYEAEAKGSEKSYEQQVELAKEAIQKIKGHMRQEGDKGKMNNTDIRRLELNDEHDEMVMGFTDASDTKEKFILYTMKDGELTLVDKGADGTIDEVIFNDDDLAKRNKFEKTMFNKMCAFDKRDKLLMEAEVTNGTRMEHDAKIFEADHTKDVVYLTNMKEAAGSRLEDEAGQEMKEKMQKIYTEDLEKALEQMEK